MDGSTLIQVCACTARPLADGRPGVIWRGQAFPLLGGNIVDVSQLDTAPATRPRFALLHGHDETCILVSGLSNALDTARAALIADGIEPLHAGRWLGDPVEDYSFDWFIRCYGTFPKEKIAVIFSGASVTTAPPELRLPLLEQQIIELRARFARVRSHFGVYRSRPLIQSSDAAIATPAA